LEIHVKFAYLPPSAVQANSAYIIFFKSYNLCIFN
jgi:hypothetical protein